MSFDDTAKSGFFRISEVMTKMVDAAHHQEKETLLKMSETFMEDGNDFLAALYDMAGIEDEDIEKHVSLSMNDASLIKEAEAEEEETIEAKFYEALTGESVEADEGDSNMKKFASVEPEEDIPLDYKITEASDQVST